MAKQNRYVDKHTQELIEQTQTIPLDVIEKAIKQSLVGEVSASDRAEIEVKTKAEEQQAKEPYIIIDETKPKAKAKKKTLKKDEADIQTQVSEDVSLDTTQVATNEAVTETKAVEKQPIQSVTSQEFEQKNQEVSDIDPVVADKPKKRVSIAKRHKTKQIKDVSNSPKTIKAWFKNETVFKLSVVACTMLVLMLVSLIPVPRTVIVIDGTNKPEYITTTRKEVNAILADNNIVLNQEDQIVNDKQTIRTSGDTIEILRVTYETEVVLNEIPYDEVTVQDPLMFEGQTAVTQEGQVGKAEIVHNIRLVNKQFDSKQETSKNIVEPVNKVISVGTRSFMPTEWASGQMTGYSGNCSASGFCGSHIYNGPKGRDLRIVAAPPEIPFCTIIEFTDLSIPGLPQTIQAIVLERGSAIHGNVFDLLQPDFASSASVGRQHMQYRILEVGEGNKSCWQ